MRFVIREENMRDIDAVREIVGEAFPTGAESKLVDALRANGKAVISLVAIGDGQVLGHILFSPVSTSPPGKARGLGLAPVAVRSDARLQGIGSRLIQEGLQRCKELGFDYCVVLGSPEYYQRFGFEKASTYGLQNEYGVDDAFMVFRFEKASGFTPLAPGLVRYESEFGLYAV